MNEASDTNVAYVGPPGGGLGFRLAGIEVFECSDPSDLLGVLNRERGGSYDIIFIDESLAENVVLEIEKFNDNVLPAIVLIASPSNPRKIAARKMDELLLRAVGSDIINK